MIMLISAPFASANSAIAEKTLVDTLSGPDLHDLQQRAVGGGEPPVGTAIEATSVTSR